MIRLLRRLFCALVVLCLWTPSAEAQTLTSSTSTLTTVFHEEKDDRWTSPFYLLKLPQAFTETALGPVMVPILLAFEKLHVHEHIFDLLTNDEKTFAVVPIIDPINRSGFSAGVAVLANDPLGSPDRTIITGTLRANGDRQASFSYGRRVPSLSGRRFSFGASYSLDHDARYFGIGGDSSTDNERALGQEAIDVSTSLELPGTIEWNARVELAFRMRSLATGRGKVPGVRASDDVVAPPPGFDRRLFYPEGTFSLSYDSRDASGRPSRGVVADVSASVTHAVDGASIGGVTGIARIGTFIPVLPLHRILVLTAGFGYALTFSGEIPFHSLISLGGNTRLRGYTNDRFVDRLGWWSTAEYRYKIYEWAASGNGLSSTLFVDAGQVGRKPQDFVHTPLRWSVGFGFRIEMNLFFLARIAIATSPEGPRLVLGVSEIL